MLSPPIHPPPQKLRLDGGPVPRPATVVAPAEAAEVRRRVEQALGTSGGAGPPIRLVVDPPGPRGPQSYRLELTPEAIVVAGADVAGLFYGSCTLIQLLRLCPAELPGLQIEDWPDYPQRAVMLDVSRDRVPTMETLRGLVELLASWKVNQLQLYVEHTFAYRGHEAVWRGASPLTPDEIRELDALCQRRHVELVPNQNSFGHLHRWLIHEPYRQLAECPEGIVHPFSPDVEPYSLCPIDPGSLALLADLYDQLLPCFASRQFNVGLDETLDLGLGRSKERCAEVGTGRVYLEFLKEVHRLVAERGRRMQFWGDIILSHPELVAELPKDAIALEWGYEADHPFDQHAQLFASAGLELYLCPGTSSWNSIAGRPQNAVANVAAAALCGRAAGARGLLVADWGDNGHMQPLPASFVGLLAGAAFAWNASAAQDAALDLAGQLDRHAFSDRAAVAGRALVTLGDAHQELGVRWRNGTLLFRLLITPEGFSPLRIPEGLTPEGLERTLARIDEAMAPLDRARIERPDADLLLRELRWAADALRLACRLGLARLPVGFERPLDAVPAPARRELAVELRDVIQRHRELWLARSRPGGLESSVGRLARTLAYLER